MSRYTVRFAILEREEVPQLSGRPGPYRRHLVRSGLASQMTNARGRPDATFYVKARFGLTSGIDREGQFALRMSVIISADNGLLTKYPWPLSHRIERRKSS